MLFSICKCSHCHSTVTLEFSEALWLCLYFNGQSFFICVCYHPPRPKYPVDCFVNYLDSNIDDLIDPNQLPATNLEIRYGLSQLFTSPTHSGCILDMFYTSRPDLFCVSVITSAIIANCVDTVKGQEQNSVNDET